ncbi:alanine racemase [Shigella flexneri]
MLEGFFDAQDLEIYDQHRLTTFVHGNWQLETLQNARGNRVWIFTLKVNSGINRLASSQSRAYRLAAVAGNGKCWRDDPDVAFAEAEHRDGISSAMARIEQAAEGLSVGVGCPIRRRSVAGKRILTGLGLALFCYGASPSGQWRGIANTGLRPVMTLAVR